MEVSEPYALVRSSADRYLIAEYSLTAYTGFWVERHGYLIGVYDEELGEWRFADSHMVQAAGVRKFVPNADLSMLPSTLYFEYARLFPLETEYLTTVEGGFRIQGDGEHAHFELEFDINKRIREEMDVLILFENPSNAEDPITVHTTLAERQKELLVQSPLIAGFKPMHIYGVTVVGLSADDEDEFVHRQPLYYFPIHGGDGEFVTGLATTGIGTERIIGMP
jgi:hypothetical protein